MSLKEKFIFFIILFLAVFFRFYLINQMPGGLFPDMAANGLDINLMQQGHLQPFYERGNGREALFFYMEWATTALFGKGVWQFSIVSALVGVLAVIMCYFVCYRLMLIGEEYIDEQKRRRASYIALLAMFLMAVSSWHIVLSRTAFRATLIPLFSSLTIYFFLRCYQSVLVKTRLWFAFLSGASFALGFYTYIAFRIMAPILVMALIWPLLATIKQKIFKNTVKKYFWALMFFLFSCALFMFPLARYFYTHPGSFLGRSGQVSVFNPELYLTDGIQLRGQAPLGVTLSAILEVTKISLLGYFTKGDLNWRHNISGYPFLSPLVSPFFAVGLVLCTFFGIWYFFAPVKRRIFWKYFILTGWFWGMLIPVITTAEGIPHGLRAIGTLTPVYIICAWVIYSFVELVKYLHKKIWQEYFCKYKQDPLLYQNSPPGNFSLFRRRIIEVASKILVACFILALVCQTYILYFVYAYNDPTNFYYFRSDLTQVSQYLVSHCAQTLAATGQSSKTTTYLVLDKFSVQTTDFLTSDRYGNFSNPCNVPYIQVDPERVHELPKLSPGDQVVFAQSSMFDTKKFKQSHPEAFLNRELRNKFNQAVLAVYSVRNY